MHTLRHPIQLAVLCSALLGMLGPCSWARAQTPATKASEASTAPAPSASPAPAPQNAKVSAEAESTESSGEPPPNAATRAAKEGRAFIAHLPLGSERAPLALRFDVRGDDLTGEIRVYFRPLERADQKPDMVVVVRESKGYVAHLPEARTPEPGIAYWVVELKDGVERPVFASAAAPQPVHVQVDADSAREERLLRLFHGQRSRVTVRGERVDLGQFDIADPTTGEKIDNERDGYYHLEAQYAYRFFRTIEELEFALGRMRGDVLDQDDLQRRLDLGVDVGKRRKVGLDYGRSAITFAFGSFFRLRTGVLLGVSTTGFEGGFELATILGERDGTQLEFKGGYVSGLGGNFGTRLGWATVPRVPMGASVEITNFPTADDLGVRMLFDLGFQLTDAALVRLVGGYRGRTSLAGGPSFALEANYGF